MKDLHNNIKVTQTLDPVVGTADVSMTGVDTYGYDSLELIALIGESGDTLSGSVYFDVYLEESSDNSTFTAVAAADALIAADGVAAEPVAGLIATIDAAAEDDIKLRVGYIGSLRYARLRLDFTGTHTNGIPVAGLAVQGCPRHGPVVAEA
jgi:hypothetical protein